jgi:hypothetical protein
VDLLHHDHAIADLAQKHLIGIRGDDRTMHQGDRDAEIVKHGFQRFELGAHQDALEPLLFLFHWLRAGWRPAL